MTLTEFLLARIAEDEVAAKRALAGDIDHLPFLETVDGRRIYLGGNPHRVLAECATKRRIIKWHPNALSPAYCATCMDTPPYMVTYPCPTLRELAQVYADHPDYRDEWRP